jgi:hypothetical protein
MTAEVWAEAGPRRAFGTAAYARSSKSGQQDLHGFPYFSTEDVPAKQPVFATGPHVVVPFWGKTAWKSSQRQREVVCVRRNHPCALLLDTTSWLRQGANWRTTRRGLRSLSIIQRPRRVNACRGHTEKQDMKKLIAILRAGSPASALGFAQHDANQMKYVQLLNPVVPARQRQARR